MIENFNGDDLLALIKNSGQNEANKEMINFANGIPKIKSIEDIVYLDKSFYKCFSRDTSTKKFERTSGEIFLSKTFSGCSDIGLAVSAILRIKNIPTVYVESARIDWIEEIQKSDEDICMQGHIFLEIYINNTWYLYDPTYRTIYKDYDYNNFCLPRNYYAFVKALNCHEIGIYSVKDEKKLAISKLHDFDVSKYNDPNYIELDLRKMSKES